MSVKNAKADTQMGICFFGAADGTRFAFSPVGRKIRCGRRPAVGQQRSTGPSHWMGSSPTLIMQKRPAPMGLSVFGAADGTRTRTVSLPGDFKSPVSTDSTTAAAIDYDNTIFKFRQVTADPDSGHRHPDSNPGTSSAPAGPWPSWHPRSASPRNRTPYCLPSVLPDT